jgi:isopentenyl phosphate kinase
MGTEQPTCWDELVFVKLGGSVITDKTRAETPRSVVIARLAAEVAAALDARPRLRLVLGHGSGSFGHITAVEYGTRHGVKGTEAWEGFVRVADVAARLNRLVARTFLEAGVPVWSLQPSASARCREAELTWLDVGPIAGALDRGLVPLVYGDVALDDALGGTIISTEQIIAYLAEALQPDRLVLVSQVDGVFEADPTLCPGARRFDVISPDNWGEVQSALSGSSAPDVTGGMLTKVATMMAWVRAGTGPGTAGGREARLVSGQRPGALQAALLGDPDVGGTLIR